MVNCICFKSLNLSALQNGDFLKWEWEGYALLECTLLRKIMHSDHSFCYLNVHTSEELKKKIKV